VHTQMIQLKKNFIKNAYFGSGGWDICLFYEK